MCSILHFEDKGNKKDSLIFWNNLASVYLQHSFLCHNDNVTCYLCCFCSHRHTEKKLVQQFLSSLPDYNVLDHFEGKPEELEGSLRVLFEDE